MAKYKKDALYDWRVTCLICPHIWQVQIPERPLTQREWRKFKECPECESHTVLMERQELSPTAKG